MEKLHRRQPTKRRRFQIRGERSGNGQQIYAPLDIFAKKPSETGSLKILAMHPVARILTLGSPSFFHEATGC